MFQIDISNLDSPKDKTARSMSEGMNALKLDKIVEDELSQNVEVPEIKTEVQHLIGN